MKEENSMSENLAFEQAKLDVKGLLHFMGEDVEREGLADTPRRVVEMYQELTEGYSLDPQAIINKAIFQEGRQELVIVKDIPFYSLCEHHLAPFFGTATIGYIPSGGKVVGLSKLARVLDAFAKRLQVQERLGAQIAEALMGSDLRPNGVGVYIEAEHLCMAMRGVQKPGTSTVTNTTLGWLANRTVGNPGESDLRNQWNQTVLGR